MRERERDRGRGRGRDGGIDLMHFDVTDFFFNTRIAVVGYGLYFRPVAGLL